MIIEIKVPELPESVSDAVVSTWYKKVGEPFEVDDNLLDLETDKVMLEVPANEDGVLVEVIAQEGQTVKAGDVLAKMEVGKVESAPVANDQPKESNQPQNQATDAVASPAVRRAAVEHNVDLAGVVGTGKGGRISKEDVLNQVSPSAASLSKDSAAVIKGAANQRTERRVPMSRLRAKIAERLLDVQQNSAILTTFNEVNMKPVMDLRKTYKDRFEKQHGVRLGFMSFFVKATIEALKQFPTVNASVDGQEVVYHDFYDIGIAVGTDRGLVVPILRNADTMSMASIEKGIREYAQKAQSGKLTLDDMKGGTFSITNGGVYGSMLSTPIINPPQSAILGMHNIVERPVAENGQVVIRPVMYLALSYDHRLVDGKESVSFLVKIKEMLEDPTRLLLEV